MLNVNMNTLAFEILLFFAGTPDHQYTGPWLTEHW